ncbi:MAG: hypothetical protein KJ964_10980 [Verrucomicrobia bacterium]|nr:hypothetical protein [Verrucomicrobiota bacterium]MBU1855388.1 hypothetical protein [Verrucomicrobiota bacterium]
MSQHIRAGVSKIEITCKEEGTYDDCLSEKAKKHIPAEYLSTKLIVDDPLFARVLVLDDGSEKVVWITMDVTAIGARTISQNILSDSADNFMPDLRKQIEKEFNIPGCNVCVSASHTHQAPRLLCDDAAQINRILEAIKSALQNMAPVVIGVGSGYENTITVNRTIMMKNGTDHTLSPFPPENEIEGLRPIDPEIGILRIDRLDGNPFAVVYNFASHLLLGSPQGNSGHITADHVGVTLKYLENNLGGETIAFFLQGAGGDINEIFGTDSNNRRRTVDFGTKLGQSILKGYQKIITGPVKIRMVVKNIAFPFRTDIPNYITALKQEQAALTASLNTAYAHLLSFKEFLPLYLKYALNPDYPSHLSFRYLRAAECGDNSIKEEDDRNRLEIKKYLDRIKTMEQMTRNELKISMLKKHQEVIDEIGTPTIPAEIQGVKIGECVFITAPMEILTEVGFDVKKMSPFKHTYIASISNGYLHYAPPASYYRRGGYEVTECLLAPAWEDIFYNVVKNIFDELKK